MKKKKFKECFDSSIRKTIKKRFAYVSEMYQFPDDSSIPWLTNDKPTKVMVEVTVNGVI
mgnify:CR=1 FL=1